MKKSLKIMLAFLLFLTVLVQPVNAASKTVKIKVTLVSIDLLENNHVGNEWYTAASINGKEIEEGSTITLNLKPTESIKLKAYVEEQDKIPDVGTEHTSVKVSSISKKVNKHLVVEVVENRGRYSGNTAEWKFSFNIQK